MVHAAGMILPLALGAVSTFANALLPAQPQSAISAPPLRGWTAPLHEVDANILEVLEVHDDPVKALLALQPELEEELAEPRLLQIFGETHLQWKTEGDKLRLRRMGKRFIDLTGQEDLLDSESAPVQPPCESGRAMRDYIKLTSALLAVRSPKLDPPILDPTLFRRH